MLAPGALLPALHQCCGTSQNVRPAKHFHPCGEGAGRVQASAAASRRTLQSASALRSAPRAARCTLLAAASGVQETTRPTSSVSLVDFFRQASLCFVACRYRSPLAYVPTQAAPYIAGHRGRTFVVVIPGSVVASAALDGVLADVALCHALGVRLVLVVGCSEQARLLGGSAGACALKARSSDILSVHVSDH
jgi:hypothetical protein